MSTVTLRRICNTSSSTMCRRNVRNYATVRNPNNIPNNTKIIIPSTLQTNPELVKVTLFPGHGIGPEISDAVINVLDAAGANIEWERHEIATKPDEEGNLVKQIALDSVRRNGVALKGPLATPIGKGYRSINLALRQEFQLYANVRPARTIPAVKTPFQDVDVVTVRENTEGEYCGLEHEVVDGVVESLKIITRKGSMRIAKYAFDYARKNGRKRVTAVHKANIMKMSDGLFLECCREVSRDYPDIVFDSVIVDACCMMLVKDPTSFDVLVTPNLYGDIVSDLCAGLIGGLGLTPSANFGEEAVLFEAVHGTAPDIAGQDKANPTAFLLSACMMLEHLGKRDISTRVSSAVNGVLLEGKYLTGDLGGKSSCSTYTKAIIDKLE